MQDRYYNLYGRRIVASYREAAVASLGPAFFSAARHHGAPVAVAGRSAQLPSRSWRQIWRRRQPASEPVSCSSDHAEGRGTIALT